MSSEQTLIAPRSHSTRLLIAACSILAGWVALFAISYLFARPLLAVVAPWLGASWLPTAQLALECAALAATGWIVCRLGSPAMVPVFAAMLLVWNFGLVPSMNISWLLRLFVDSIGNARYLASLINAAATHALLFGSLIAGAKFSRPARSTPVSLMSGGLR